MEIPEFPALHSPSGRPSEKLAEKAWSRNRRQQADRRARPASIVVQSGELRLACRVPEEKQAKLVGLKLGDKVEIPCVGGTLAGIQRTQPAEKPSGDEVRIYGLITALSDRWRLGRGGLDDCSVPEGLAGRAAEHFVLGDRVKMTCRGSEVAYLEKVV